MLLCTATQAQPPCDWYVLRVSYRGCAWSALLVLSIQDTKQNLGTVSSGSRVTCAKRRGAPSNSGHQRHFLVSPLSRFGSGLGLGSGISQGSGFCARTCSSAPSLTRLRALTVLISSSSPSSLPVRLRSAAFSSASALDCEWVAVQQSPVFVRHQTRAQQYRAGKKVSALTLLKVARYPERVG